VPEELRALREAVQNRDGTLARERLAAIQDAVGSARSRTDDPVWRVATHVPWAGSYATTFIGLSAAASRLAQEVLPPLVTAASVDPSSLVDGDRIDLQAVRAHVPDLVRADAALESVRSQVAALPRARRVPRLEAARTLLAQELDEVAPRVHNAAVAAQLVPPMLGADGPRRYFVAFQTNAEARGTGGLIGGYGVLTAVDGRVSVARLGDNSALDYFDKPVVDLGPEYERRYGAFQTTSLTSNANMSPHFPYAARIWAAMWQQQSGESVDGVIATDPAALSYVLEATGPATLANGERLQASDVVRITQSDAYSRFAADNLARKAYLQDVSRAALTQLLDGAAVQEPDVAAALLRQLQRAAGERRLLVSSLHPQEQELLAGTSMAGELPDSDAPFVGVVVNNAGGDKLDYYLQRAVTYTAGSCERARRPSTVALTLRNTAPAGGQGLPEYVTGVWLDGRASGTNHLLLSVYATRGAELMGADVDGVPALVVAQRERDRPVYTLDLMVPPEAAVTVRLRLDEPTAAGAPVVLRQPMVHPMKVSTSVPRCG
jgi:hypothetical protein